MWLAPARLTRQAGHNEREPTMTKFPWKTTLAGAALLAATVYAFAQHPGMTGPHGAMHEQMLQGQGAINGNGQHGAMHGQSFGAMPTLPGQDAFGAIQEVVQILQADPKTDWSKVDIAALRQHLIDMNEVTLHAEAVPRMTAMSIPVAVTGEGRTLAAIKRMVPAHVHELESLGWKASTEEMPNGVRLVVTANDAAPLERLKALGFIGIMVQGGHHQPHHLMIAKGQLVH
jgi:hypothetical protein